MSNRFNLIVCFTEKPQKRNSIHNIMNNKLYYNYISIESHNITQYTTVFSYNGIMHNVYTT